MPPVFLINLDRSPDRLARMRGEFKRAGLGFERFVGVNRTDLPESVKPYFCDRSGRIASSLRPGEIGCYASHLALWQRIATGDHGAAVLVCEDDMTLPDGFGELIRAALTQAPQGWGLINLSGRTKRAVVPICQLTDSHHLVRFSRDPGSAAAYLISRDGARKLLRPGLRNRAVDQDVRRPWAFGIDTFGVWPPLPEATLESTYDARGGHSRLVRRYQRSAPLDLLHRPAHGIRRLGIATWARCAAWNIIGRKLQ
jgi:glycosyl transferase family 25